jgi:hypothetical protein
MRRFKVICKSCEAPHPEHFTDRNHCCECADHDDLLRSRDIDLLTIDDLGNPGWDPICFVTDKAFFYCFPALEQPSCGHAWYFEQLIFHLTYEDCLNRRLVVANPRQKEAVLLLLGHVQDTRSALAKEYRCEKELEQALAIWRY